MELSRNLDRGWAWIILSALFFALMVLVGFQHSYGIFFVEIQQRYGVTASMASLVGSVFSAVNSVTALVVMSIVLNVLSERQCLLIGAMFLTSALSASWFATSFPVFVVTLGALGGMGGAFIQGPGFVLLGKYFRRYLILSQAIANSGMSVGGVVMPQVIRAFLDHFTFPAGLLMVAAVLAHIFVCAVLFRPVTRTAADCTAREVKSAEQTDVSVRKGETAKSDDEETYSELLQSNGKLKQTENVPVVNVCGPLGGSIDVVEQTLIDNDFDKSTLSPRQTSDKNEEATSVIVEHFKPHELSKMLLLQQHKKRPYSDSFRDQRKLVPDLYHPLARSASMHGILNGDTHVKSQSSHLTVTSVLDKLSSSDVLMYSSMPSSLSLSVTALPVTSKMKHVAKSEKSKFTCQINSELCRNTLFWMIISYQSFGCIGGILARVYLPPLARERHLSDGEGTVLLTVVCGLDIFSRLLPGVFAHFPLMKPRTLLLITLIIQGILFQFTYFFTSFAGLLGLCVVLGCLNGVFYSMIQTVIVEFMGLQKFAVGYGVVQLFHGATIAAAYLITGALKDVTGTFVTSFQFIGATQLLAAGCLASLPYLRRRQTHELKDSSDT